MVSLGRMNPLSRPLVVPVSEFQLVNQRGGLLAWPSRMEHRYLRRMCSSRTRFVVPRKLRCRRATRITRGVNAPLERGAKMLRLFDGDD
jgi:hypothetical protein